MRPCNHLEKVFKMELKNGNELDSIEFRKWTNVDKVFVFKRKHRNYKDIAHDSHIKHWERANDLHRNQNGYECSECRCSLAFPIDKNPPAK